MFFDDKRTRIAAMVCLLILIVLSAGIRSSGKGSRPATAEVTELRILMYHQVLQDSAYWGKYVISPAEFEQDLQFLKEKGYETVGLGDVLDFVKKGKPLPQKAVMLTFDDGHLSFARYIMPLLEKYDARAVLSVIGTYSDLYTNNQDDNPAYAHVTWQDVKDLFDSGRVDIANHSYDLHKTGPRQGTKRLAGESVGDYEQLFAGDTQKTHDLICEATGVAPDCFTYPFGFFSPESEPILKEMGYSITLGCTEGVNSLTGAPEELFGLKRYNRPHGKSAATILQ